MEIVIIVAIWTVMVKRGVEDILHTARGGTPPRLAAAKARRSTGAAGRYWSALWDDVWTDLHNKHVAKHANPDRPRGAATVFWSNLWRDGWVSAERRRQRRTTRPRPGQDTVPGEVVPNAQDGDRPQDGDGPEPHVVPDEDGRTDLRFGDDPTDPTGTKQCPECGGTVLVDGEVCLSCRDRQEQRNQHRDDQDPPSCPKCGTDMTTAPNIGDPISYDGKGVYRCPSCDYKIRRSPETTDDFTQEGPTMTATAVDGTGLDPQIKFCEESEQQFIANAQSNDNDLAISKQFAEAYRQQVAVTDAALGAVPQGVAVAAVAAMHAAMDKATAAAADMEQIAALYTQAMDKANSAAADMSTAVREFVSYKNLQEGYAAQPDAPDKEFLLAGR